MIQKLDNQQVYRRDYISENECIRNVLVILHYN
jgi:hypothetical protein